MLEIPDPMQGYGAVPYEQGKTTNSRGRKKTTYRDLDISFHNNDDSGFYGFFASMW